MISSQIIQKLYQDILLHDGWEISHRQKLVLLMHFNTLHIVEDEMSFKIDQNPIIICCDVINDYPSYIQDMVNWMEIIFVNSGDLHIDFLIQQYQLMKKAYLYYCDQLECMTHSPNSNQYIQQYLQKALLDMKKLPLAELTYYPPMIRYILDTLRQNPTKSFNDFLINMGGGFISFDGTQHFLADYVREGLPPSPIRDMMCHNVENIRQNNWAILN